MYNKKVIITGKELKTILKALDFYYKMYYFKELKEKSYINELIEQIKNQ